VRQAEIGRIQGVLLDAAAVQLGTCCGEHGELVHAVVACTIIARSLPSWRSTSASARHERVRRDAEQLSARAAGLGDRGRQVEHGADAQLAAAPAALRMALW